MADQGTVVGILTDGTGVSSFTPTKFVKDFVADVLLSGDHGRIAAWRHDQAVDAGLNDRRRSVEVGIADRQHDDVLPGPQRGQPIGDQPHVVPARPKPPRRGEGPWAG